MKITVEAHDPVSERYILVTVAAELSRMGYLDGWRILDVDGIPVHADHASIYAKELDITDNLVEIVARKEAGL